MSDNHDLLSMRVYDNADEAGQQEYDGAVNEIEDDYMVGMPHIPTHSINSDFCHCKWITFMMPLH